MKHDLSLWDKIDGGFERVAKWLVYIAATALLVIMALAFVDVIVTKLFGSSIRYCTELITQLDVPVAYLGMAYTLLIGQMTAVDLLFSRFPMKVRRILSCVYELVGCVVCLFLAWLAFGNTVTYFQKGTTAGMGANSIGFVLWPFVLVEAISWLILGVAFLFRLIRYIRGREAIPGDATPPPPQETA